MRLLDGETIIQGAKGGGGSAHTPVEQADDLLSEAKLKMVLALSEGEIQGDLVAQQIFLNDTPLANDDGTYNFTGVKWDYRKGTQDQTYLQGMPEIDNESSVGIEVKASTPWTRQFSNLTLDAIRIKLSLPIQYQYKDNGDMVGTVTEYAIDLSTDGAAYKTVVNGKFDGKTTSEYQRDHRIDLPDSASGWTIRVRRITPDSTSTKLINAFKVFSFAEVIDSKLRYPNTALLYVELDSSQFNGSVPKTTCKPKGKLIRVPTTYDPVTRTYSGTWSGDFKIAYSNNPAWIFYDLVLDEIYGMGNRVDATMIDKWELYSIAQYCDAAVSDGAGGTEPRFTCNVFIQSQQDAYTVLRDLAAIFRGITFWGNDQIFVRADVPQDDVDFTYHSSNVVDGMFTYAGGSYKNRFSSCQVSWSDPINHYSDTIESVYEPDLVARYNWNETQLTAIGCTSQSEAHRRGRWVILSNAKDGTVSFGVGLDGYIPMPAEIVGIADPFRAGKANGGRISAVNGNNITVDRVADYGIGDRLVVNLPDGTAQTRTISGVSADKKTFTVTTAYRMTPVSGAVWAIDSDNLAIQYFRITSISSNDDGTFTIAGVQHDPNKYRYIDDGVKVDSAPITVTPTNVMKPPSNIVVTEVDHIAQGLTVASLQASWDKVEGAINYTAQWRKDNGDWVNVGKTSAQGFTVQGIYAGVYDVRVRAVNAVDVSSPWGYAESTTLNGKVGKPGTPTNLLASDNVVWNINVTWAFPAGSGDTAYTELQQSTTDDHQNPTLLVTVPYPGSLYQHGPMAAGVRRWYRARLVDRIGNVGEWTDFVMGTSSVDVSEILGDIAEEVLNSDVGKQLVSRVDSVEDSVKELDDAVTSANDKIDATNTHIDQVNTELQGKVDAITGGSTSSIAQVVSQVNILQQNDVNQAQQISAVTATANGNKTAIATETTARATADTALGKRIDVTNAQVGDNKTAITTETTARATADTALGTRIDNLTTTVGNNTTSITSEATARATADSALGTRIDAVKTTTDGNTTAITSEVTARTTADNALGSRIDSVKAATDSNTASISSIQTAQTDADQSLTTVINNNESSYIASIETSLANDRDSKDQRAATGQVKQQVVEFNARITETQKTIADGQQAFAEYQQTVSASIQDLNDANSELSATVQTTSSALVDLNGKASAQWGIKLGINSNGQYYAAGMGIGLENTPAGMQSTVAFLANNFVVMSDVNGAPKAFFAIRNGQTFMNEAFIGEGTIDNAKIGNFIQSTNYVANVSGWRLDKGGTFVNFGSGSGGKMKTTNSTISVADGNGVLRVQIGELTGVF
ncbi:host specificity protein [Serratia sp. Leaf51]|nr:host specificity protein [Serratia sp. Leaf51]